MSPSQKWNFKLNFLYGKISKLLISMVPFIYDDPQRVTQIIVIISEFSKYFFENILRCLQICTKLRYHLYYFPPKWQGMMILYNFEIKWLLIQYSLQLLHLIIPGDVCKPRKTDINIEWKYRFFKDLNYVTTLSTKQSSSRSSRFFH